MKDSDDPRDKRPSRRGRPTDGEPSRSSGASSRQPKSPRPAPHIPGTLSRDGTPKAAPVKRASQKSAGPARQSSPKKSSASAAQKPSTVQPRGAKKQGPEKRTAGPGAAPQKTKRQRGRAAAAPVGKAQRKSAAPKKLSTEEVEKRRELAAQRLKRRKQIYVAIAALIAIIMIASVAVVVRGQLAKREEQIVAQSEDTSYEIVPCEPNMVDIELRRTGTIAGYPMTFGLTITNTSEQSCSIDAGSKHLVMDVKSGNDQIWSSGHCPAGDESRMYVFGPGVSSSVNVEWSGSRSTASCEGGLPAPKPGTYVVEGSIDGVDFPDLKDVFILTDSAGIAPEPEPEVTTESEETTEPEESAETDDESDESTEPLTDESPPEDYIPD